MDPGSESATYACFIIVENYPPVLLTVRVTESQLSFVHLSGILASEIKKKYINIYMYIYINILNLEGHLQWFKSNGDSGEQRDFT